MVNLSKFTFNKKILSLQSNVTTNFVIKLYPIFNRFLVHRTGWRLVIIIIIIIIIIITQFQNNGHNIICWDSEYTLQSWFNIFQQLVKCLGLSTSATLTRSIIINQFIIWFKVNNYSDSSGLTDSSQMQVLPGRRYLPMRTIQHVTEHTS